MMLCSVNVVEGEPSERQMTTGSHIVRDIYCIKCGTTLGWKYVSFLTRNRSYQTHDVGLCDIYKSRILLSTLIRSTRKESTSLRGNS